MWQEPDGELCFACETCGIPVFTGFVTLGTHNRFENNRTIGFCRAGHRNDKTFSWSS